jgi:large subunit ribosomal protein L6
MSRIGRSPIPVPTGVEVSVAGRRVTVKGPQGTLERDLPGEVSVRQEDGTLLVERAGDDDATALSTV